MDWMDRERMCALERRVAILEGKPDPGVPCGNCDNGYEDIEDHPRDTHWKRCSICNGTSRIYPTIK